MKKIVLARIDERLIHGQVMTQWVRSRHFNTIEIFLPSCKRPRRNWRTL